MQRAPWWQTGVIYQIYPRSFQDSDGDGVGDLGGIVQRLPYLTELGVDAIWFSPIFPSPMADFGYDISDYTDIDPLFGSLADFDALLAAAHAHGLKLFSIWCRTTPPISTPGSGKAAPRHEVPARLVYLAGSGRGWRSPNNWRSDSAAAPGNMIVRPASTTIMLFWPPSRISTGAMPTSARQSTRSCVSGSARR